MNKESLNIIRQAGREGLADATLLHLRIATKVSDLSNRVKLALVVALAGLFTTFSAGSAVAATCGGSDAAGTLSKFISSAAIFMIALGGAGALLMFAVGGCFIIFGGTNSRVQKGMGMIKHAVMGLVVLAAGVFIKLIVLKFVDGATKNQNSASGAIECGDGGLS